MKPSRSESFARAASTVAELDADLRRRRVWLGATTVTPVAGLRGRLASRLADHLQGAPSLGVAAYARAVGFAAKERTRDLLFSPRDRWPEVPRRADKLALFVPRRPGHLRDLEPVARFATGQRKLDVAWLTFVRDHARRLSPAVYGPGIVPLAELRSTPQLLALERALLAWRSWLDRGVWSVVARELALGLPSAITAASALVAAIKNFRPSVVVVSNPYATEGAIAAAIAAERGIKLATLQHGDISLAYGEWNVAKFDLATVWGEASRERLLRQGVADHRIAVTGAPWADALALAPQRRTKGRPKVLVAVSGAGHAVGLEEHLGQIARIVAAAAATPSVDWLFRLHPKDSPQLWQSALSKTPAPNAAIQHGPDVPTIQSELATADALLTVTSTAALDAMLYKVPVITLARRPEERPAGFVEAGATTEVPLDAPLAEIVERVVTAGPAPATTERAKLYIAEYFGPRDGGAAARVVDRLVELAGA